MSALRRVAVLMLGVMALAAGTAAVAAADQTGDKPASVGARIPFDFIAFPYSVRDLPLESRLFSSNSVLPRVDDGVHDSHGVRMKIVNGKMYNTPREQANYGLSNLNSYRLTNDAFYLDRALAQAQRLLDIHDVGGHGWYYPSYPSRYRHGVPGEPIKAPYYSALPQGRDLLLFSRLAEMTGEERWRNAAAHTFAAYLRPGPRKGPYVVNVDDAGYYWLQEWPWPNLKPDCTLNGHITSLTGLYEYYEYTRDRRARALFRGAVTTVRHYLPDFRDPGWISNYCLAHHAQSANYHRIHVGQLLTLYELTGAKVFARAADRFQSDYPPPRVDGGMCIAPGTYAAVRFGVDGRVVERRAVGVRDTTRWDVTARRRPRKRSGVYLRAASGPFSGYWFAERPGRVYLRGATATLRYVPARSITIKAGQTCRALTFDEEGTIVDTASLVAKEPLTLAVDRQAVVNGRHRVRLSEGALTGYWLQLRRGVRLH